MPADCCRFCDAPLRHTFVDLGMSPLCESFVPADKKNHMEPFYPLHVWVCDQCWLVQLQEYVSPAEIFTEYAYFSSFSESWLAHARKYVDMITARLGLGADHHVVEIASNDGYLLRNFVARNIPCTGIEPAANVAKAAEAHGVQSVVRFFGRACATDLAAEGRQADLIIGNNVLAHVPDINDFVGGLKILLKPGGVVTMEFPHLQRLMEGNQFDTIYHEHFGYLSILAVGKIFAHHGLRLFDVEELKSHGGSLRIFAAHADNTTHADTGAVDGLLAREVDAGFDRLPAYQRFADQVVETKRDILDTLIRLKRDGKRIVGYGAPGKGNTLLNYCGIRQDFLDYTVDRNPYKHGRYCPGTHIPIHPVEKIGEDRPDFLFILPWNLKDEIIHQMAHIRDWGGQFIVPIPKVEIR